MPTFECCQGWEGKSASPSQRSRPRSETVGTGMTRDDPLGRSHSLLW